MTFVVPDDALDKRVPSFLLQPIVENAVRHGVAPRVETGHIAIGAAREADALVLSVEDDGPGFAADPFAVGGVGLPPRASAWRCAMATRARFGAKCGTPAHGARS